MLLNFIFITTLEIMHLSKALNWIVVMTEYHNCCIISVTIIALKLAFKKAKCNL